MLHAISQDYKDKISYWRVGANFEKPEETFFKRREFMLRVKWSTLVLVVSLMILWVISSPFILTNAESKTGPNEIVIGLAAGLKSWDPHDDLPTHATGVRRQVYETLTTRDENLNLVPLLATKWEPVGDKAWRFQLQPNAKFHNGLPVTGEDVKFSLERAIRPDLNLHAKSYLKTIKSVEVAGQQTVLIHTTISDPILPARLAFCGFIVPKKTVEEMGMETFRKKPIGSGPFVFVEWVLDDRIVLDRNKSYWGKPSRIDRVVFKPIPETSTRLSALQVGEVDLIEGVSPDQISQIKANRDLEIDSVRSGRYVFIILNKNVKPFDNKLVRQAMNYAVDVQGMATHLFSGHAHPVSGIGAPAVFGFVDKPNAYPYNPDKARELLAKAGYPKGFETKLPIAIGRPFGAQDIAQTVSQSLKAVGVTVTTETYEWGEYLSYWLKGTAPMYYMGFGTPTLDLDDFIGAYLDPSRRATWGSPPQEAIDIANQALKVFDPKKRIALYDKYISLIQEDAPFIFLFNFDDIYAYNKKVQGFKARADEQISVPNLSKK
jgi:peptide/nickel transport system substrate-binding protein